MAIIHARPLTAGQRFKALNRQSVAQKRPEKALTVAKGHKCSGRNCYGRITMRRRGGGHKRLLRNVDFRRDKLDIPAKVQCIEYDPNRSAQIALLAYADGEKRYILSPEGLKVGDVVQNLAAAPNDFSPGISLPLSLIPLSFMVHCVELSPGRGAQLARAAGVSLQLLAVESGKATLRMPSGEVRYVDARCRATLGVVGNGEHNQQSLGKAGRNRWLGKRPRVRGVAMNPIDHPMGGGEGKTSGGGHPVSKWGQLAKGFPTRHRSKNKNTQILIRRNGKKVRKG
ncbi:MAG: 50S ribosomal protein L2 [Puniceicoccales bacterium]|jgi:large subunit ribosomal protein L2|nr:50S ribosomal protein L2 [Puniceicoccales bacterium]